MKRAFTLVELLVVILIIWIVLGAFAFLMLWYQKKVAFKTDIMKFKDDFFVWDKVYSTPQSNGRNKIGYFLIKEGTHFGIWYGDEMGIKMEQYNFKLAEVRDIYFRWEQKGDVNLIKMPYNISCPLIDEDGNVYTGKISFKFVGVGRDYCADIDLNVCKLTVLKCRD